MKSIYRIHTYLPAYQYHNICLTTTVHRTTLILFTDDSTPYNSLHIFLPDILLHTPIPHSRVISVSHFYFCLLPIRFRMRILHLIFFYQFYLYNPYRYPDLFIHTMGYMLLILLFLKDIAVNHCNNYLCCIGHPAQVIYHDYTFQPSKVPVLYYSLLV